MDVKHVISFLSTIVWILWQMEHVEAQCNDGNATVQCLQGSTLCINNICDGTTHCNDTSDETAVACNWKGFLTLHTPSIIWVEQFNNAGAQQSQLRGLVLPAGTSAPSPVNLSEYIDGKIYSFVTDHNESFIFYASETSKSISRIQYRTVPSEMTVYRGTSGAVYYIAIDRMSKNIYWTDDRYKTIMMSNYDGRFTRVIVTGLDKPRGLAVDPLHGHVYWSDCAERNPRIERASLSGDDRSTFVDFNLTCPTGLKVDYTDHNRLYFLDDGTTEDSLFYVSLGEEDVVPTLVWNIPTQNDSTLSDCATYDDEYFVTKRHSSRDGGGKLLVKATNSSDVTEVSTSGLPWAIQVTYPEQTTGSCDVKCEHLCVMRWNTTLGHQCVCSHGYHVVNNDTSKCEPDDVVIKPPTMIVYNGSHIVGVPGNFVDLQSDQYDVTVILEKKDVKVIDFNLEHRMLYFADLGSIYRLPLDGENQQPSRVSKAGSVSGIAVDWISSNIYWTDDFKIIVSTHDGARRKQLLSLEGAPTSIAVLPQERLLFYSTTDIGGEAGTIHSAYLDGTGRRELVTIDDMKPTAITLDYRTRRIYWIDSAVSAIRFIPFNGSEDDVIYYDRKASISSLTLLGGYLYWTDRTDMIKFKTLDHYVGSTAIESVPVTTDGTPRYLVMFDKSRQPIDYQAPCFKSDCSGICLANLSGASCVPGEGFATPVPPTAGMLTDTSTTIYRQETTAAPLATTTQRITTEMTWSNRTETIQSEGISNRTDGSVSVPISEVSTPRYSTGIWNTEKTPVYQTEDTETDVTTVSTAGGERSTQPFFNLTTQRMINETLTTEETIAGTTGTIQTAETSRTTSATSTPPVSLKPSKPPKPPFTKKKKVPTATLR